MANYRGFNMTHNDLLDIQKGFETATTELL